MSTHVIGFLPPDERWEEMKHIWVMCEKADVEIPKKVIEFFRGCDPGSDPGREVDIKHATVKYLTDSRQGYEIDLTLLPKDVKILRFFNSY